MLPGCAGTEVLQVTCEEQKDVALRFCQVNLHHCDQRSI